MVVLRLVLLRMMKGVPLLSLRRMWVVWLEVTLTIWCLILAELANEITLMLGRSISVLLVIGF